MYGEDLPHLVAFAHTNLSELRLMNINGFSLFPDLDGIGRYCNKLARQNERGHVKRCVNEIRRPASTFSWRMSFRS